MRIAIAVDGSENSLRAVREAVTVSNALKQTPELLLLNVHLSALISPVAKGIDRHQIEQYMDQIAEEELKDAKKILAEAGLSFTVIKGHGEVAATILDIVKKQNLNLLVVGGKGRSSISDLILGSVTTKLISHSPVPVLVVK
ncbi:MAG: universal stress protein [Burkholderiaceae bacterium]|jgi:nucleotide-binding universal stress UspA family protein